MRRFTAALAIAVLLPVAALSEGVSILAIGNSFTRNALKYFYPMAQSAGVEDLVVANMHISGCSLKKHYKQISKDLKSYEYYYRDESGETMRKKTRMSEAIAARDWDYVVLQQTGGHSGVIGLYTPYLKNIISYVKNNATNPDVRIVWHATWAYSKKCRNHSFARYSYNQKKMYNAIVNAEQALIYPNPEIDKIIPVGRAIQGIRDGGLGDTLNVKDGYHLNDTGCYAAALAWVYAFFGVRPEDVSYRPVSATPAAISIIQKSVLNAVNEYSR